MAHLFSCEIESEALWSTAESETLMPAVMFQQCSCGMEIKTFYEVDDTKQFYTCTGCERTIEVLGTILKMYTCPASSFGRGRDWIQIPKESLRSDP